MPAPSGHSLTKTDLFDPARANALLATLGLDQRLNSGDVLPPFFHHIYFWDPATPDHMRDDGLPKAAPIPEVDKFTHRTWMGGKLTFHQPMIAGVRADRTTTIESVDNKDSSVGLRLRHDIRQRHSLVLTEWQDLVFSDVAPWPTSRLAPTGETLNHPVHFDPTTLFRYSALTFDSDRSHFDAAFAQSNDGFAVHVPLLVQLLALMAQADAGTLTRFAFRATAPLSHLEPAQLCLLGRNLWAKGADNRQLILADFK